MIKIVNNYLDNQIFYNIQKIICRNDFLWTIQSGDISCLEHFLVREQGKGLSLFTNEILNPILLKLNASTVLESKVTLYPKKDKIKEHPQPSNFLLGKNYKTFLLYLSQDDGYFKTSGLKNVVTKENMAISFDYPLKYFNTNGTKKNSRTILSIHYQ